MVAKQHAKIANARRDFQHALSRRLTDRYDQVFISKLEARKMLSDGRLNFLNRQITDAAWGEFLHMLRYKAESAGSVYVEVDARSIAQGCSGCGQVIDKDLGVKLHDCPFCQLALPRGVNAARNVRRWAVQVLQGGS